MYNGVAGGSAAATAATLPLTGVNTLWLFLAGFTVVSAGFAIRRMIPKRES